MIFIILCVLLAVVIVGCTLDSGPFGLVSSTFIGGIVAGLIFLIIWAIVAASGVKIDYKDQTSHQLQALGNGNGTHGGFFLGSGYTSDKQVINYIEKLDNNGSRLKRVDASEVTIYEVDEEPTLITRTYEGSPWWLAPFDTFSFEKYEFRVPNGTVSDQFEVTAN